MPISITHNTVLHRQAYSNNTSDDCTRYNHHQLWGLVGGNMGVGLWVFTEIPKIIKIINCNNTHTCPLKIHITYKHGFFLKNILDILNSKWLFPNTIPSNSALCMVHNFIECTYEKDMRM